MTISLLLASYLRPNLLRLGLSSIVRFPTEHDLEILVLNDGIEDGTKDVCEEFSKDLPIRYIFTGARNVSGGIKKRGPGFALNIGIKQAKGDVIILSCPEVYHLNKAISIVANVMEDVEDYMVIPSWMYFDTRGEVTNKLLSLQDLRTPEIDVGKLTSGEMGKVHVEMPYLMGIYRKHLLAVGGYCEKMTGYAGEDTDLVNRLLKFGVKRLRVGAQIIHLYHEGTNDGGYHWENERWVYNYNILKARKEIVVNEGIEWGKLDVVNNHSIV